jgi:hypothetical protein
MSNIINVNDYFSLPDSMNYDHQERKVGVEIEYAGLGIAECAELVVEQFGGVADKINEVHTKINDTKYGDFHIELDSDWIKRIQEYGHEHKNEKDLIQKIKEAVNSFAENFVPFELITPPIPISNLAELELLRTNMRKAHAQGTAAGLHHAFGTHFNPEVRSYEKAYIARVIQAFLLLYPWLLVELDVDLSRRILTYIDPFNKEYLIHMLSQDLKDIDMKAVADDYVEHNPTRNRALDMLPLFAHLKFDAVKKVKNQHLIKPRPTFHYRLPDCDIDSVDWRISHGWNSWVVVERIAEDREILNEMSQYAYENIELKKYPNDPYWVELAENYIT